MDRPADETHRARFNIWARLLSYMDDGLAATVADQIMADLQFVGLEVHHRSAYDRQPH